MFCGNCGSSVDEGSAFCSGCGNKVEIKEPMKQTHTNAVAENNSRRQTEPQKNAAFGMKTIVITALAVVVLAGCGFFAWHVRESKKSEAAEAARLVAEQLQAEEDARFAAEQAQAEAAEQAIAEAEKALAAAKQQAQQAKTAEARAKAEAEQARLAEQASIAAAEARRMELEREARRQELEDRRRKAQSSAKQTVPQKPATPQKPAAPQVTQVTLAAGTPVRVITSSEISTQTSDTGDGFTVILNEDLGYGGQIIARRGAAVRGVVSESDPGGRVKGVAAISVTLSGITLADGSQAAVRTNEYNVEAPGSVGKDVAVTGITTGIGAAIGAIAGGGKGAAIGAGAGAAGGVGVALATRGNPAVIAPETVITFNLAAPLTVTLK